jgi:hypothetical protein
MDQTFPSRSFAYQSKVCSAGRPREETRALTTVQVTPRIFFVWWVTSRLRRKLNGSSEIAYALNVWGVGYRLVCERVGLWLRIAEAPRRADKTRRSRASDACGRATTGRTFAARALFSRSVSFRSRFWLRAGARRRSSALATGKDLESCKPLVRQPSGLAASPPLR